MSPLSIELPHPRPLPVLLLLDTSGSMNRGNRIDALNRSVNEMMEAFKTAETIDAEIWACIVSFGGEAPRLVLPLSPLTEVPEIRLTASGKTYMAGALRMAKSIIEDRNRFPRPCYRPLILLLSDGLPSDDYETALSEFLSPDTRSSKCDRMAIHFGGDDPAFGPERMARFVEGTAHRIFKPEDSKGLDACLRAVTLSMTLRSRLANPNQIVPVADPVDPEGGYF